ncbi:MAG: rare lipoprotein A (peptidoglycan hydrolase) [Rickettsiales bacterium]|jgi:rare lipoprotein A (peptidoglycan hydrolase)
MKRIYLTLPILALSILTNANAGNGKLGRVSPLEKEYSRESSQKRTPPTERSNFGFRKYQLIGNSTEERKQEFIRRAKEENAEYYGGDNQDIANNYITDDGEYTGTYKIGDPYEISGVTYQPKKYDDFEEVGNASWYGDAFDGKKTANGEIYHKGDMTAAHPTLPLPSMARITNLENGKSVKVRINDRGPFSKKRIADVSEKAAIELGFKDQGTARIKLEFLKEDTDEMLSTLGIAQ